MVNSLNMALMKTLLMEERSMEHAFELAIPTTLEEVCDPKRLALVVYDMQVGILSQIKNGEQILSRVLQVLQAARAAGIRDDGCANNLSHVSTSSEGWLSHHRIAYYLL
jgi:hypothetical protein